MDFKINDTFRLTLPADKEIGNHRRQVYNACFSYVNPTKTENASIIHYSKELIQELDISNKDAESDEFIQLFTGNKILDNTHPYAMCYGGHQFGNWAGQLGDGRAINLFEISSNNKQWAFQLKGAGETPYSRTADGLAVLRSSIREYLCSEAMHHLNVPTTRALSLALSGNEVLRDVMYNGNPAYEKGAIVCRVAQSFIRFGNFEILSARQNTVILKQLADYTINSFYPEINSKGKDKYLDLLKRVSEKTIDMIVHWQRVGFVHGVMNTDNMSILGLTIDYGPYGWLDAFDFDFTPNTTDAQNKRYRFGNQPNIGLWNLYKLANALYPLIEDVTPLQEILDSYKAQYTSKQLIMMCKKLGISNTPENNSLVEELEQILHLTETDYTIFFRKLNAINKSHTSKEALVIIEKAFYTPKELKGEVLRAWNNWFNDYIELLKKEALCNDSRINEMNLVNPKYILRNYMSQLAIEQADKGNYDLINELYELVQNPYSEQPKHEKWFAKSPDWAKDKVGCSKLSCSS